jgi:hypothetical protein
MLLIINFCQVTSPSGKGVVWCKMHLSFGGALDILTMEGLSKPSSHLLSLDLLILNNVNTQKTLFQDRRSRSCEEGIRNRGALGVQTNLWNRSWINFSTGEH